jgi:hypothetical protein
MATTMNAFLLSQMLAGISFLLDISAFSFSTPGYHFNAAHRLYFPVSYPFLSFGSTRCGWANDHCRLPLFDGHHHVSPLGDVGIYAGIAAV